MKKFTRSFVVLSFVLCFVHCGFAYGDEYKGVAVISKTMKDDDGKEYDDCVGHDPEAEYQISVSVTSNSDAGFDIEVLNLTPTNSPDNATENFFSKAVKSKLIAAPLADGKFDSDIVKISQENSKLIQFVSTVGDWDEEKHEITNFKFMYEGTNVDDSGNPVSGVCGFTVRADKLVR